LKLDNVTFFTISIHKLITFLMGVTTIHRLLFQLHVGDTVHESKASITVGTFVNLGNLVTHLIELIGTPNLPVDPTTATVMPVRSFGGMRGVIRPSFQAFNDSVLNILDGNGAIHKTSDLTPSQGAGAHARPVKLWKLWSCAGVASPHCPFGRTKLFPFRNKIINGAARRHSKEFRNPYNGAAYTFRVRVVQFVALGSIPSRYAQGLR
jgi:hypothetical protein